MTVDVMARLAIGQQFADAAATPLACHERIRLRRYPGNRRTVHVYACAQPKVKKTAKTPPNQAG
ncbi:hypothetical protein [Dermabacter hominis]|uniref:hypothetical protein n=1 Tax=Dermabacter hominis TaxID=36740 RepID=UPI0021A5C7A9|nr:hypothetical protein [Dermabacter hominis]MCT1716741.1 hypothetical protein [Dermabacter hominis]MCT1789476.1 hypothetical protein [Dermabacter hominis]